MNEVWHIARGNSCERTGAYWSNSYRDGSSTPTTIKSKGNPSFKSDAGVDASGMNVNGNIIGTPASGNPLTIQNSWQSNKWGQVTGENIKWSPTIARPDGYEASQYYEGE